MAKSCWLLALILPHMKYIYIYIYDRIVPLNVYNALGDEKTPMVSYKTTWVSLLIPSLSLGLSAT